MDDLEVEQSKNKDAEMMFSYVLGCTCLPWTTSRAVISCQSLTGRPLVLASHDRDPDHHGITRSFVYSFKGQRPSRIYSVSSSINTTRQLRAAPVSRATDEKPLRGGFFFEQRAGFR
jgi:hypothetical protein